MKSEKKTKIISLLICFGLALIPLWSLGQTAQRFSLINAAHSNIKFQNTITDEKDHNILLYSNYYGGAGVGIGDFNKDGLQDLFFAGNLVEDQLYFNQGNMKFFPANEVSGISDNGGWSSGVLVADVNNDGWEDIYITRELYDDKPALRQNILYINMGETIELENGLKIVRFEDKAAEYGLNDSERTRHAGFIDYNNDGWLDLFLLNQPPNPGNYSAFMGTNLMREEWAPRLYRNNGASSNSGQVAFEDVTEAAGVLNPGYPNSMLALDFNKDGWQDIYISNDYEAPDLLYINNGDGTFTEVLKNMSNHISYYSMGVDAADINNDTWLDIMTLDMVAEDNFRIKSNMSGMNPEAFWKLVQEGGHFQYMFNAMHLNNQGKNMSDIAHLSGMSNTDWSWANLIADFDNDGWKDVYVTNGLLRDIRNSDAAKTFPEYVKKVINDFIQKNPNAGEVSIFDILDLEEALDLLPSVPLKNYAFKNKGDLSFAIKTEDWGLAQESFSNGAAYADLDNDGDLDLVVNNINEEAFLYRNNNEQFEGTNWLRLRISDQKSNKPVFGSKILIEYENGLKQYLELTNVRGMYSTCENIAHFGLGTVNTIDYLKVTLPNGAIFEQNGIAVNQLLDLDVSQFKASTKLQEDTRPPLFESIRSDESFSFKHQENNFDDYEKQVLLPHKMSKLGPAMSIGDINGDGLEDVYIGGAKDQPGQIFIQYPKGKFEHQRMAAFEEDAGFEDLDALFFDIENDGDLDLYVVSGGNAHVPQSRLYQDRLYINEGGHFEKDVSRIPVFRESGGTVKACDYDADGDLDLLVCGRHQPWDYPSPSISRLLNNENGVLKDVTKKSASDLIFSGMVTDALWTDFDGDTDMDFILVGEWMPITFFENKDGLFQKHKTLPNSTGWWYSIEGADIDDDGDMDYFAGNLGLNYKYKATVEEPFEVHYHDFDNNGSKDIVLSYYNFGERYPLRGRSCSSEQIPTLENEFPSYNIFADSELEKVYGTDNLAAALHYSADNFASVFIENKGNEQFEITALPKEAQVSSINDFIIEDFDQDGYKDVVLAGNLFTSEIETPRNDAGIGLLLKGNGQGKWSVIKSDKSGINLPYDIKRIRKLKAGDNFFLLFACNDDKVQVLKYTLDKKGD